MSSNVIPFMRVTLFGMTKSGKSSLVNVFVNNVFSDVYEKTTAPLLYYSTLRIAAGDEEDQGETTILLEIEDTPGSDKNWDTIDQLFSLHWPSTQQQKHDEMMMKPEGEGNEARSVNHPFGLCQAPTKTDDVFHPLTRNRMGILICFDVNDEQSYKEALKIYESLIKYHQTKRSPVKLVYFLVGCMEDKDPYSVKSQAVDASARMYAESIPMPYICTSALQYKKVKKLFRQVVSRINMNQALWVLGNPNPEKEEHDDKNCTVT